MLPQKVTAPISPEAEIAMVNCIMGSSASKVFSSKAAPATRTEAIPPNPLKTATNSGMEVISILIAKAAPIAPPMINPRMIIS